MSLRSPPQKSGRDVDEEETLTSVAITPGTTFMLDLTHSLTYFCCTKVGLGAMGRGGD
jgi:5'-3' exonuclease